MAQVAIRGARLARRNDRDWQRLFRSVLIHHSRLEPEVCGSDAEVRDRRAHAHQQLAIERIGDRQPSRISHLRGGRLIRAKGIGCEEVAGRRECACTRAAANRAVVATPAFPFDVAIVAQRGEQIAVAIHP
jgi:hypothetical protein